MCVCLLGGGGFKHVAHFSKLCFSLFLVVIFYLSNCNNGFGQTLCFNLSIVTFSPVYPPRLSLYDHLKTFFNDPYHAFQPPLLLSIHLFFCINSPSSCPFCRPTWREMSLSSEADIDSSSGFDRRVLESHSRTLCYSF